MGKASYKNVEYRSYFETMDKIIGKEVAKTMIEGPLEALNDTRIT